MVSIKIKCTPPSINAKVDRRGRHQFIEGDVTKTGPLIGEIEQVFEVDLKHRQRNGLLGSLVVNPLATLRASFVDSRLISRFPPAMS